jgi:hypothetical protein
MEGEPKPSLMAAVAANICVIVTGIGLLLAMANDVLFRDHLGVTIGAAAIYIGCCITSRKSQW